MRFTVKDILEMEVTLALGCTEPVAIALGAAAAATLLPEREFDSIEIWIDPNIYKNAMAVTIPGTGGLQGLDTAAALGAYGGDPKRDLEVLESVDEVIIAKAQQLLAAKKVKVNLREEVGLHVRTRIIAGTNSAESLIIDLHNNIVSLSLNGVQVTDSPLLASVKGKNGKRTLAELEEWLRELTLDEILELTNTLDEDDLNFLQIGVNHNLALAEYGLQHGSGLGIGKAIDRLIKQKLMVKDMSSSAKRLTSAAADARMGGVKLPAMSSAGSGNHGLTAILPIWAIKDFIDHDRQTVLRAIGLSHIVTAYVKAHTGRLSAVCGCSVAAGAGATAGITYLVGGDVHHMEGAIKNILEDLAGVICDGAKAGCAIKLNTAAGAAVQAALFSLHGVNVKDTDGIIGDSTRKTIQNMGELSHDGMVATDKTILKIMLEKQMTRENKQGK
ncbi:serine dehydratase subunit alpha family protein [Desulforhopalus sp. IMCC35007]|uniref:L-cysteine desulfidase family protein n=1 Tax=Desulforhopalus sp. IMCC35007 TaxID=2569543 RepID=UPI0010AECB89|nr:L-serine ammonia-lyase, iron-sulfur-dependent, subunit alpha [Desulforhopalus sp. IMCC35007]TKB09892.1 serine dehydratase subunit alpha family protein [Desulforhopalus sp. IMCC35007]